MKGASGVDSSGTPYVINVGCFTNPTSVANRFGNSPRNALRIPATFNSDLAFFKNIKLGEKRQIQLRWEIYNLFNRANFDDIDATLTYGLVSVNPNPTGTACTGTNGCSAIIRQNRNTAFGSATSFGTPTTARTPRVMQGSIRINF
jgi:hypothetical protein